MQTEKLELRHLAPYLPYELMVRHESGPKMSMTTERQKGDFLSIESVIDGAGKPILYPLSRLTTEIESKGERFVPIERLFELYYPGHKSDKYYYMEFPAFIDCSHIGTAATFKFRLYEIFINFNRFHVWTGACFKRPLPAFNHFHTTPFLYVGSCIFLVIRICIAFWFTTRSKCFPARAFGYLYHSFIF